MSFEALGAWVVVIGAIYFIADELRKLFRHFRIKHEIRGMTSGPFIEHGMVEDPKTGMLRGQQKPSAQAYRNL